MNPVVSKYKLLSRIASPADFRDFSLPRLEALAREVREYIIDVISVKQGHLGSNLGVVELTVALHYLFDTPRDVLLWDVGHQAYAHKILTGRLDAFYTQRETGGISGFPRREESPYDAFGTGHSSTSISALTGMWIAGGRKDPKRRFVAVIGDASISSGMALEAMNYAGGIDADILVVLNDNGMGIDPNTGALAHCFSSREATESFFRGWDSSISMCPTAITCLP